MNSNDDNILEQKQFFLEAVSKFCDKCGTAYLHEDINILQTTGIPVIIHFTCHKCKSKSLVMYGFSKGVSNRMPLNTDLSIEELEDFSSKGEVSLDEILEIYSYLKTREKVSV